jgi:hypothetical protein
VNDAATPRHERNRPGNLAPLDAALDRPVDARQPLRRETERRRLRFR